MTLEGLCIGILCREKDVTNTFRVILSGAREDAKRKRGSHGLGVRSRSFAQWQAKPNGAKPQAKRSGIYDIMRYSLPNESNIPTTPREIPLGKPRAFGKPKVRLRALQRHLSRVYALPRRAPLRMTRGGMREKL